MCVLGHGGGWGRGWDPVGPVWAPQCFCTDCSGAVLLLWFLAVACSCCPCLYFGSAVVLVTYFVNFRWLGGNLFGRGLFVRFAAGAFRGLPPIYVFS